MNFTGYFLLGSKFGGLTRKPWTLSLLAPVNQKGSSGEMETWERTESFTCVSWRALAMAHVGRGSLDSPRSIALNLSRLVAHEPCSWVNISVGAPNDIWLKTTRFECVVR